MKLLPFTKMHGIGNDFIIVDQGDFDDIRIKITPELIQKMCDRNFGIGADGVVLLDHGEITQFQYIMYNHDGTAAEMCGNGIRCYMKHLFDEHIISTRVINVETGAGILKLEIDGDIVTVDMGKPGVVKEMLYKTTHLGDKFPIKVFDREFVFIPVSMGNPHAVICLKNDSVEKFNLKKYGKQIENDTEMFPNKINVEFVEIISNTQVNMRVWERGAGETLACGTGACAVVVAGILSGKLKADEFIAVNLDGGTLEIKWSGHKRDGVIMRGPATKVFEGTYYIEEE